jgi:hypothetical protein
MVHAHFFQSGTVCHAVAELSFLRLHPCYKLDEKKSVYIISLLTDSSTAGVIFKTRNSSIPDDGYLILENIVPLYRNTRSSLYYIQFLIILRYIMQLTVMVYNGHVTQKSFFRVLTACIK